MLSFHNNPKIKAKYLRRIKAHRKADNIIHCVGWDGKKGCAIGCTLEKYDHSLYLVELGLPIWLAYLEDKIFEGLPIQESIIWPERFLQAIKPGINEEQFKQLNHDLAILRLKRTLQMLKIQYKQTPLAYLKKVIKSMECAITYHQNPTKSAAISVTKVTKLAAISAAKAAGPATVLVVKSARSGLATESAFVWSEVNLARAAASSAWSAWSTMHSIEDAAIEGRYFAAAGSLESTADAARFQELAIQPSALFSTAGLVKSAVYIQESEDLLRLLKKLTVKKQ